MEKWQNPGLIAYWIGSFLLVVLVLALFIILLVRVAFRKMIETKMEEAELRLRHRESLLETSLLVQEKERTRIAADIHDELIGKLVAVQLSMNSQIAPDEKDRLFSECITSARRISHDLVPPMIGSTSLTELVSGIIEPFMSVFQCRIYSTIPEEEPISTGVKLQVTRLLQECLINSRKHALASGIFVQMKVMSGTLLLKFSDNGKGFSPDTMTPGLGLKNIETRMHYLKGKYKMRTGVNKGTSFLFAIQLNTTNYGEDTHSFN